MKKFKTLLFSSVPFFLSIGLQFVAVYYLLFIAAIFLFAIAPALFDKSYSVNDLMAITTDINFNAVISIVFSIFCIAVFAIWYYKSCGGNFKIDVKKSFHRYEILGIILLVPGAQFLSSIVSTLISLVFPSWMEEYMNLIESAGLTGDIPILMVLYSVFLAPISEELVFRGVTFRIARSAFPFWAANIIQALLFGIFHMNPLQSCYTFVVGLFMGYICEKGGTLYHAILFHFLFNLWGTTVSQWIAEVNPAIQLLFIFVGTGIGLAGGLHFLRKGNRLK